MLHAETWPTPFQPDRRVCVPWRLHQPCLQPSVRETIVAHPPGGGLNGFAWFVNLVLELFFFLAAVFVNAIGTSFGGSVDPRFVKGQPKTPCQVAGKLEVCVGFRPA